MIAGRISRALWTSILAVLAGCGFSPNLPSGTLACGPGGACPQGQSCSAARICCAPDDLRAACAGEAADAGPTPDSAVDAAATAPAPAPAPAAGFGARRVVAGPANLVGFQDGCTQAVPPSAPERWCAFSRGTELWVLNVTRAAREAIPCNDTDPGCLRLTDALYPDSRGTYLYTRAKFSGDLLTFYAEATHAADRQEPYKGGIYAWFPGWPRARKLTTAGGQQCISHSEATAPAAFCADRAADGTLEVRAGTITADAPLPVFMKLTPEFYGAFTPGGGRFLFGYGEVGQPKPVFIVSTADILDAGKRIQIAERARWFDLSAEGTSLYYLEADGVPGGNLFAVDTATGLRKTMIASGVERAEILGDGLGKDIGVVSYREVAGEVGAATVHLDTTDPAAVVSLGRVAGVFVSPDRRFSLTYARVAASGVQRDLALVDNSSLARCDLQTEVRAIVWPLPVFSGDSRFVFWSEPGLGPDEHEGWVGALPGCGVKRVYSRNMLSYYPLAREGLLYLERTPGSSALQYVQLSRETAAPLAAPTLLATDVDWVSVIEPDGRLTVFSGTRAREGLYIADLP